VAVARLREALGDVTGEGGLVRTVIKRGYVLAAR
jgi:DNA-binding winged helix-turn-helix (wHTH) protein